MTITLPRYDKRTAIIGSTGSGKSVGAMWLLSTKADDWSQRRPWFILDPKGDPLIEELQWLGVPLLPVTADPRKAPPGLYILRPIPEHDDMAMNTFLMRCWERGGCGIYCDEGYTLPGGLKGCTGLTLCLTQGRSKHVEMMILSQRPRWMSKFVFTEADYFMVYNLTTADDRKHVGSFIGEKESPRLPKHNSYYYDVGAQAGALLKPVPSPRDIIAAFEERLERKRHVIR